MTVSGVKVALQFILQRSPWQQPEQGVYDLCPLNPRFLPKIRGSEIWFLHACKNVHISVIPAVIWRKLSTQSINRPKPNAKFHLLQFYLTVIDLQTTENTYMDVLTMTCKISLTEHRLLSKKAKLNARTNG